MRKLFLLLTAILLTISCENKTKLPRLWEKTDLSDNPTLINANRVGNIHRGTTVNELYSIYPAKQIRKTKSRGGYLNQSFDDYNIYDPGGKLLLTATPEIMDDTSSYLNRIIIRDSSFHTEDSITLNSTLGDIRQKHFNLQYSTSSNEIIISANDISTNFIIKVDSHDNSWWNKETNQLISRNIPDSLQIDGMVVFWNTEEAVKQIPIFLTGEFWNERFKRLLNWSISELPSIIILIIIFILLLRGMNFLTKKLQKLVINKTHKASNVNYIEAEKRINTLSGIMTSLGKIFLWTIFLLILLGKFNINIAPILTGAGIVGLAVGFGAQELVRDFISGFFILLDNQLRVGDTAIINGTTGTVEEIELRTVTLRDINGTVHVFQNGKIDTLSNTTMGWSAIILSIGVGYKEDIDRVVTILKNIADQVYKEPKYKKALFEPLSITSIEDFTDNAIILKVTIKTLPNEQWAIARDYRSMVKKEFDKNNIEFPYPYRTITWEEKSSPIQLNIENKDTKTDGTIS